MTPSSSAIGPRVDQQARPAERGASSRTSIDAVDLHRRAPAGEGPDDAARRPPGRGHRRRHDGDRHRRAVEAARRPERDDRLSPRRREDEGEPVRARTRPDERRRHPHLGAAGRARGPCRRVQRRGVRGHPRARRRARLATAPSSASRPTCCSPPSDSAARPRRWAARRSSSRTGASSSTASGAPACKGVWAGGDCVLGGEDLTVSAVEDGKQAARSIVAALGVASA